MPLREACAGHRFNLGQASSNGEIQIFRKQFQSKKTLITKEMANYPVSSTGVLRAHGLKGWCLRWAECDGRDWVEPGEVAECVATAGVPGGMGAKSSIAEIFTILTKRSNASQH